MKYPYMRYDGMYEEPLSELSYLEMLAESNPPALLEDFEGLWDKNLDVKTRSMLLFYKCMALVTMYRLEEAESLGLELLAKAIENEDYATVARANIILSKCYRSKESKEDEKSYLDMAFAAAKKTQDGDLLALVLCHIGLYYQLRKQMPKTIDAFQKAEKQLSKDSNMNLRIKVLMDYGSAYYHFLQHDKALPFLSEALKLNSGTDNVGRQLLILNNLSTLYMMMDKHEDAFNMLASGLLICEQHDIPPRKVSFLFSLGVLQMRQDKHEEALKYFKECQAFSDKIGFNDPKYLYELNSNMAGCYRFLGQAELALECMDKAAEIAEAADEIQMKLSVDVNRASLMIAMGMLAEGRKLLDKAKKYTSKHKLFDMRIVIEMNYARSYEASGDYPNAIKHFTELSNIQSEYHSYVLAQQSEEFDIQIKTLMEDYDSVREQYRNLAQEVQGNLAIKFIGNSNVHGKLIESALLAAQHPSASVLILGESGTGKDVLAQLIHYNSARKGSPFVAVNMASVSASLLESEFFGHKRGSFTGAINDTKGLFLEANRGTLFLDEISDMPFNLQAKLLRVLESRKLTPVGSSTEVPFDTRIISSTNRNIMDMIANDGFRLDLYHRLNTIEIYIPPLRERKEDIEALTFYYADKLAKEMKLPSPRIERSFVDRLKEYRFPGNVRELRNMIERLLIMQKTRSWSADILSSLPTLNKEIEDKPYSGMKAKKQQVERSEIIGALQSCQGKQKDAAKVLGISESTLTRRIEAFNLEIYTRKGK
ncbi:MAG: sigma 54-interacting transcriptional regulator [Candidatus Cloacimonetes bacterium]|nr:sigma 54-interacting transcriptional regulator [Candidatus Cloacimonadota bacterium]